MDSKISRSETKPGVSKLKLAVGAASLFLFIVGLKRTFSIDEGRDAERVVGDWDDQPEPTEQPDGSRGR